ncbi:MAG: cysteine desulfurase [Candidatus Paralactobacillus gallistercoris]|uniref:Cysteine desulfurase n=1 Tax=Candidatus Paralactobacillus gallistercoris TaxID=2838724 RepID=A0A948WZX7_9LACO|nr:cysteine desulfurase [Candidatus Paralactobacillus gallistercoris]
MIYFDNSATTKIDPEVLKTYNLAANEFWGNPSSLHKLGTHAHNLLQQAREQIASLVHVKSSEIYFTSGGTESDNWVIKGTAWAKREFGKHIITTSIEHAAVLNPIHQLEELGYDVTYLPVDHRGFVNPEDVRKAMRKDTILVSIMAVNNEIGSIQPLDEIGEILEDYPNVHYHVDAVQAVGKGLEKHVFGPRVDFASFSSHKFHGPRGVGILYARAGKKIESLIDGGGQEAGLRSGTENLPAIAAMAKAWRLELTNEDEHVKKQQAIRAKIYNHIKNFSRVTLFSELTPDFAPHILCFAINGVRGETIVHAFEEKGIYISTTSACSSKNGEAAGTLKQMGVQMDIATSAVRISLDENNTLAEADAFNRAFDDIYHRFEKVSFEK